MKRFALIFFLLTLPVGAATVNVTDSQFAGGAVGDLRTCADMQMTSGSVTLYSPSQCNFTSADIGKWVQVPLAGDSNGTGLSATISTFTDSQHVTLNVMAGENANSGTAGTIGTGNYAAIAAVATYACAHASTTVNWPAGSYYIEKYKIIGGGSANGVTDVVWNGCTGTINTGYGASVVSNGAYRQLNDDSGFSYEQTATVFNIVSSTMTIEGLEINGSVENTTQASPISEGRSLGIVTAGCTVTLKDLNVHSWPVDSIELGLNSADTSDVISNVSAHNSGRQGLTIANVAGLTATNYQCQQIGAGFTGNYGGHPPEDCVDIEPAIPPAASGIVFTGGSLANALGALIDTSPESDSTLTITGMILDCSMSTVANPTCTNGGLGQPIAATTIFTGNTFYGGVNAAFTCGPSSPDQQWLSSIFTNNTIVLSNFTQFSCQGLNTQFTNNTVSVTGTVADGGNLMYFFNIGLAAHNTYFVSKNARVTGGNLFDYVGARTIYDNTYSTDKNSGTAYSVSYTGVNLACGEVSQEPTYFVVTGGNAPCPPTNVGAGVTIGSGVTIQ